MINSLVTDRGIVVTIESRDCPYCHNTVEQPTEHIYLDRGSNWGTYICSVCSTYYYFVGDKIYQYIPEAQFVHLDNYVKRPSRLDTIRSYRNLYYRAKEFEWYNNVRLDVTDEIIENTWTMPVEVAAQIMYKEKTGKAPGYSIAYEIKQDEDSGGNGFGCVNLDSEAFLEGLNFLKERGLVE